MDGGNKGETASFIAVYVNKKKERETKRRAYLCVDTVLTQTKGQNRVSRGCQKTESKQGKTAGEKGNRWTLSCHAEEFICVFYLVECGVGAQQLQLRLWPPLHLPGGSGRHWFCFDCETVHEIGDGLQMMILSYQDYCGISQWWEPAYLVTKGLKKNELKLLPSAFLWKSSLHVIRNSPLH